MKERKKYKKFRHFYRLFGGFVVIGSEQSLS